MELMLIVSRRESDSTSGRHNFLNCTLIKKINLKDTKRQNKCLNIYSFDYIIM
jgi:hypothetical protein